MIRYLEDVRDDVLLDVAAKMVTAAITAPKAQGQDKVVAAVLSGSDKERVVRKLQQLGEEYGLAFIRRDAGCLNRATCAVLIGVKSAPCGVSNCSYCGNENCAATVKNGGTCALNVTDLGIAIGSAISVAADNRIDNRVMYSIGKAVTQMDIFDDDVKVCYGIPLSASSKSIFFDRDPGMVL